MELEDKIGQRLMEAGREIPMRVPPGYFTDFPARLQARMISESQPAAPRRLSFYAYAKPALNLAAAFAAVFLLVYWPVRMVTSPKLLADKSATGDAESILRLVGHIDDQTFYNLLENGADKEELNLESLENYIADNYSDFDIFLETKK